MIVNNIKIDITKRKKTITEFFRDKFNNTFILITYKILEKNQIILVRLLGFEPRASWSVAKRSIQLSYRRVFKFLFNYSILIFSVF